MYKIIQNLAVTITRLSRQLHTNLTSINRDQSTIHIIPTGRNNYMFVLADNVSNDAIAIDPVDIEQVKNLIKSNGLKLRCILTTHYLHDHAGGNRVAAQHFPNVPICGGDERVLNVTKLVGNGEELKYGSLSIKCLLKPEESSGHVIYVVKNEIDDGRVYGFVGDAFSIGGFGNFPESRRRHLYRILTEEIANLRDDTEIYCGHESTIQNLVIAKAIEPNNRIIQEKLAWAMGRRNNNDPTIPSYFFEERTYNPFLRLNVREVQDYFGTKTPQETLKKLYRKFFDWKSHSN